VALALRPLCACSGRIRPRPAAQSRRAFTKLHPAGSAADGLIIEFYETTLCDAAERGQSPDHQRQKHT
jgi:hypothetical protein